MSLDLEVRAVEKHFGGPRATSAVGPVDLSLEARESVALVGPSGCGKTTLLRLLAGLTVPSAGQVSVGGHDVWAGGRAQGPALADLSMVFQDANLLPWLDIQSNVALPLRVRGVDRRSRLEQAQALCRLVGLGGFERHRPRQLSVGMRQRAAIARSLISSPRVLLLDEPFASLDAITRDEMNLELQRIRQERPTTVVLVTHSIPEAVLLADRVVVLSSRPARIVGEVAVPFARPRPLDLQHTLPFQELVRRTHALLTEPS